MAYGTLVPLIGTQAASGQARLPMEGVMPKPRELAILDC
jgi:hypothetical protein